MKNLFKLACFCLLSFGSYISASPIDYQNYDSNLYYESERPSYQENDQICSSTECYTIGKKLGEGAFGEVYKVTDSQGNEFALKAYKVLDEDLQYSLYNDSDREFMRGQLLDHPNIIKSYDLFIYESPENFKTDNIVLELVHGDPLYSTVRGSLSKSEVIKSATQFCDALNYAFTLDLMHLDLHAGNVMMTHESDLMIIDLASFFSFSEVISGFESYYYENEYGSYSGNYYNWVSQSSKTLLGSTLKQPKQDFKAAKLQKVFAENPNLVKQMHSAKAAIQKQTELKKLGALSASTSKGSTYADPLDIYKAYFGHYYFNQITDVCAYIISKSELSRDERLELRAQIKKVCWNYEEDLVDNINLPVENYFKDLNYLLQKHLN